MLLQQYLLDSAERFPDSTVVLHRDRRVTYGRLATASMSIAGLLMDRYQEPGFRAAILTDDPFEYVSCYFGILLAGGIVVGLNTQTSVRALIHGLSDCSASVLLGSGRFLKLLTQVVPLVTSLEFLVLKGKDLPERLGNVSVEDLDHFLSQEVTDSLAIPWRSPCDIAQLIYTSGTTGPPKGVMLTHNALCANTSSILEYLQLTPADRCMVVLPFFYSYGNSIMLTHVAAGASLSVNQNFLYPNVILDQMREHEVTGLSGVPSTFAILLHRSAIEKYTFPSLRYITQAGAAMSPATAMKLKKVFPGVEIYIMYGQTEASARLSYLPPKDLDCKPDSVGIPIPGVELLLLDEEGRAVERGKIGEIVARGENIMSGYWNLPQETSKVLRKEGLWTGDLAYQDKDGYFYIVSRKSDIIKSGSHRIGPKEIEDVIMEHHAVQEVAVVGVPDALLDEKIKACVVLKPNVICSEREIKKHCKAILPAYKVPHVISFLSELPKTATGKIKRSELR